jgi:hypothetical protein
LKLINILSIALALSTAMAVSAFADLQGALQPIDIHRGAILHVKGYSIWFTTEQQLYAWKRLQRISRPEVMKAYQDILLRSGSAFQFNNRTSVEILSYISTEHSVEVRMTPQGGKLDTSVYTWWVDDRDCIE